MAMSMLRRTMMLHTEQKPNMSRAQNRVNSFIPAVIIAITAPEKCYISFSHNIQNAGTAKNPCRSINRLVRQTELTLSGFLPFSSKSERLTRPKTAQNKDWVVSKRLQNLLQMRQDACPLLHLSWLNSQSFFSKANLTLRYVITLKNSNIFYKNIRIFAHQPKYSSSQLRIVPQQLVNPT